MLNVDAPARPVAPSSVCLPLLRHCK